MKLAVIGDTHHYRDGEGRLCTIAPVAAQLDRWAALFDHVVLCTPLLAGRPPPQFRPYESDNVAIVPIPVGGGPSLRDKVGLARRALQWWRAVRHVARDVDAVHLRSPCNVTLVAIPALASWRGHKYAIYAGNWDGYQTEPWSYRAQRWMLRRPTFGGPVHVYTTADPAAPHVVPFFSPSLTRAEWEAEGTAVEEKLARLESPNGTARIRLVNVGALSPNKNQRVVIQAVARLRRDGLDVSLDCAGDGESMGELLRMRRKLGLEEAVTLHGTCSREAVMALYRHAHFNVLASRTEGYPKVVVEGMAAGAVPLTSRFPMADHLLGTGMRGRTFAGDDPDELARVVATLASDTPRLADMVRAGRAHAGTRTLDAFGHEVRQTLERHWSVRLPALSPSP